MINLRPFLRLIRFPNVFTSVSNILAAYLLTTAEFSFIELLFLSLVSAFLYSSGMIFNDLADVNFDRQYNPGRPIIKGDISEKNALICAVLLMLSANLLSLFISFRSFIFSLFLSLLILCYDFLLKKKHWTAALGMGSCRFMNWMLGMSAGTILLGYPFFWLVYIALLTLLARFETIKPEFKKYIILLITAIPIIDGLILVFNGLFWQGAVVSLLILPVLILRKKFYMT